MSLLENIADGIWKDIYKKKIKTLNNSLALIRSHVNDMDLDEEAYSILAEPYYLELDKIYSEELPVIKAEENSDVLFHIIGPQINSETPKTSLVKNFLETVSSEINKLTKAIAGVKSETKRIPKDLDLSMTGFAGGSLYLGFSLIVNETDKNLLNEEDVLVKSTREAIKTLGIITKYADNLESEELKKEIDDPRVRDYAYMSLKELSPSSQSGIEKVVLSGKTINDNKKRELDTNTRNEVLRIIKTREVKGETDRYNGQIREIDLDAKRFEMRSIIDRELEEIRCIYPKNIEDKIAKGWLNEEVRVTGQVEYNAKRKPKLIQVESVKIK